MLTGRDDIGWALVYGRTHKKLSDANGARNEQEKNKSKMWWNENGSAEKKIRTNLNNKTE